MRQGARLGGEGEQGGLGGVSIPVFAHLCQQLLRDRAIAWDRSISQQTLGDALAYCARLEGYTQCSAQYTSAPVAMAPSCNGRVSNGHTLTKSFGCLRMRPAQYSIEMLRLQQTSSVYAESVGHWAQRAAYSNV